MFCFFSEGHQSNARHRGTCDYARFAKQFYEYQRVARQPCQHKTPDNSVEAHLRIHNTSRTQVNTASRIFLRHSPRFLQGQAIATGPQCFGLCARSSRLFSSRHVLSACSANYRATHEAKPLVTLLYGTREVLWMQSCDRVRALALAASFVSADATSLALPSNAFWLATFIASDVPCAFVVPH